MLHPGLLYLISVLLLLFVNKKIKYIISLFISLMVIFIVFNLSTGDFWEISFLRYTLTPFYVDNIAKFTAIIFSIIAFCCILYVLNTGTSKFILLTHIYAGSALMVVFSADLFTFYVFWELMTISSFFLILNQKYPLSSSSSYYYFIMHLAGGISLLWGIFLQYSNTGSLALTEIEYGLPFFIIAIGIKMAFIGLHTWMPSNYSRVPFYITVILSAFTTKIGVFAMYRLLGGVNLAYAGVFSAFIGVLLALNENNVRKIFTYSIISQIGYIIAGFGAGTIAGNTGGLIHLFNHILYKTLLFMVIGVIIYTTNKENLSELGGLIKKLPFTTVSAIIASLAIAGIPLTNGYIGKLIIKEGLSSIPVIYIGLYITGIGTSLVFIKFIYYAFFRKKDITVNKKPTIYMVLSMNIIVLIIIVTGFKPDILINLLSADLQINYFSLSNIWYGLLPALVGTIMFFSGRKYLTAKKYFKFDFDPYLLLARGFNYIGIVLQKIHNGDLSRYLVWFLSLILIIWIRFIFF